jgi:predicted secreted protein
MTHLRKLPAGMALAISLALAAAPVQAQVAAPAPEANQLRLSASVTSEVGNDLLIITFAAQREAADAAAVQAQLMQALQPALAEARKAAQPGQLQVSTGNFSVQPRYAPKGEPLRWQGVAEMRVEGRDFDAITRLVGRVQTMSVSQVGHGLSREAREKEQAELAQRAIARFRSQAETYAKAFGFSSYSLRAVEVDHGDAAPPVPRFRAASADMAVAAASPLPVEAGKTTLSTSVSGSVQMK